MSTTWNFYAGSDSGLTVPAVGGAVISTTETHTDRTLRFGSPVAGKTLQASSGGGVSPIQVIPVDAAEGTVIEAAAIRLALSAAGLDSATPGAPLTIGTTLTSGPGGAVVIYARTVRGGLGSGVYADLRLDTTPVKEG